MKNATKNAAKVATDWTDAFPIDLLSDSQIDFVVRHGPREIRRMAAIGRTSEPRMSCGRYLPLRYSVAARIMQICQG